MNPQRLYKGIRLSSASVLVWATCVALTFPHMLRAAEDVQAPFGSMQFSTSHMISQTAYLKASNTDMIDYFGTSVAIHGNTLVIGAPYEDSATSADQYDNSAPGAGAVYVFVRENGQWSQQAYLKASNAELGDEFGSSVALDGDTLVVGATHEDSAATGVNGDQTDNSAQNAGAVYVFVREQGQWSQQAYLKASNTDGWDIFGSSVALSDATLVVSAVLEDSAATGVNGDQTNNNAIESGAVYVFVRENEEWSQQAYLKASNTEAEDEFGSALTLDSATLVVGAIGEDSASSANQSDNSAEDAGAVYVFERDSMASLASWSQQAYVKPALAQSGARFGRSLALYKQIFVVGAWREDLGAGANGGAAYVFEANGTQWLQTARLTASNAEEGDHFGSSVAVYGATLVIGAWEEASAATGINGDQADNSAAYAGAAYVFGYEQGQWSQQAYLKASNSDARDHFGSSVALAGDTLVVGAPDETSAATGVNGDQTDNSLSYAGAAYVFELTQPTIYLPMLRR